MAAARARRFALALKAPLTADERREAEARMQPAPSLPVAGVPSIVSKGARGTSVVTTGGALAGTPQTTVHLGINFTLRMFDRAPSARRRRQDSALAAEYEERLKRLQARVSKLRDLVRPDSLPRDSTSLKDPKH